MIPLAILGAGLAAGGSIFAGNQAKKAAQAQAQAAAAAAAAQEARTREGLGLANQYYGESKGYLAPHAALGEQFMNLTGNIVGINGTGAQDNALAMYQSSPRAQMMSQLRDDTARRTMGEQAAIGSMRSGATTDALYNRNMHNEFTYGYNPWEDMIRGGAQHGLQASGLLSNVASRQGDTNFNALSGIGGIQASGIVGQANAKAAGMNAFGKGVGGALGAFGNVLSGWGGGGNALGGGGLPWTPVNNPRWE